MSTFSWARSDPPRHVVRLSDEEPLYVVSDLHLGDGSRSDAFMGKDRLFLAFLERVKEESRPLVIAGDIIDFPQALTFTRALRAHGEVLRELSHMAERVGVTYVWGNHDSDMALYRDLLRWEVCSAVQLGERVLLQHGHQYDPYIGPRLRETTLATTLHHQLERLLGTWIRPPLEQHYTLANRLLWWAGGRGAQTLRALRGMLGRLGLRLDPLPAERLADFWAREQLGDAMGMFPAASAALRSGSWDFLVCGHSHQPGRVVLEDGKVYVNTGSWTFERANYAYWDGSDFTVHDWATGRLLGDEEYRPLLDGELEGIGVAEWFHEEYLGWLRFRCGELRRLGLPRLPWRKLSRLPREREEAP